MERLTSLHSARFLSKLCFMYSHLRIAPYSCMTLKPISGLLMAWWSKDWPSGGQGTAQRATDPGCLRWINKYWRISKESLRIRNNRLLEHRRTFADESIAGTCPAGTYQILSVMRSCPIAWSLRSLVCTLWSSSRYFLSSMYPFDTSRYTIK